jgi:DNA-binding MarR family transcriptional regulator
MQLDGGSRPRVVTAKATAARELQASIQGFVRSFGLLVTKQTPCGQPVSPSIAHALMALLEREAAGVATYQHELAELLGLDRSSITRLCSRLEADGRLEQASAPDDARARLLRLTASGQRMARNLRAASLERFTRIVDAIPASKRRPLLEALQLLTAAVQTLEEEA